MLLSGRWLYVHMPKTGGTWIERTLEARGVALPKRGQHDPAWHEVMRALAPGRVVWGTTRDPWSWYASTYLHSQEPGCGVPGALDAYGRGSRAFRDVLRGWTHSGSVEIPEAVGVMWTPVPEGREAFQAANVGLWTWAHRYFYGTEAAWMTGADEWLVSVLADGGQLREGVRLLTGMDVDSPPDHTRFDSWRVSRGPARYEEMYDAEMIAWVREADSLAGRFQQHPFRGRVSAVIRPTSEWEIECSTTSHVSF